MKNFIKNILMYFLPFFGKNFIKLFIKIPKVKVIAYILLYQHDSFVTLPEHGTILKYKSISPIKLVKTDFVQNAQIQFDKQQNYGGQKVALIAHWDPQNIIDPYVFYYAQNLKKFGYTIILCSANEVQDIDKTNNCFDAVIYRKNSGYDFSSWKAALTV
ncbi:MAG: hypothetical protein LBD41_01870, partial [Clostridiales Family XIII bacterium]|nr:hypothetical protein [Clostridiales Family XIII bacterium]